MAYSLLPISGIQLGQTATVGLETFGNDGLRYVFAVAGAAIAASVATCSINTTTFVATGGAGTYQSYASMASGDYGWFSKASV
jgi:hypothetical protein